jgi:hypothetical protein
VVACTQVRHPLACSRSIKPTCLRSPLTHHLLTVYHLLFTATVTGDTIVSANGTSLAGMDRKQVRDRP